MEVTGTSGYFLMLVYFMVYFVIIFYLNSNYSQNLGISLKNYFTFYDILLLKFILDFIIFYG